MGYFSAGPVNKAIPSFWKRLKEYRRLVKDMLSFYNSESVHIYGVALSWMLLVPTIFIT